MQSLFLILASKVYVLAVWTQKLPWPHAQSKPASLDIIFLSWANMNYEHPCISVGLQLWSAKHARYLRSGLSMFILKMWLKVLSCYNSALNKQKHWEAEQYCWVPGEGPVLPATGPHAAGSLSCPLALHIQHLGAAWILCPHFLPANTSHTDRWAEDGCHCLPGHPPPWEWWRWNQCGWAQHSFFTL